MKNRTRPMQTETPVQAKPVMDVVDAAYEAKLQAARDKHESASVKVEVQIDADTYGFLCSGALIHGLTVPEVIAQFLLERVTDWSNDDFSLDEV